MDTGFRSRPEARYAPPLPAPGGPLSSLVLKTIAAPPGKFKLGHQDAETLRQMGQRMDDPLSDHDLQLSLSLCYELHYLSFRGVETAWEWDPGLLGLRAEFEQLFIRGIGHAIGFEPDVRPDELGSRLLSLGRDRQYEDLVDLIAHDIDLEQTRELVIHRSPVRLRRPDPYGWAMTRLRGPPRRALAKLLENAIPERSLYSKAMRAVGLDSRDGAYLDLLPGSTLAEINLMSFLGFHRRGRAAMLGQIAMQEILSPAEDRACGQALRRLGFGDDACAYFDRTAADARQVTSSAVFEMAEGQARIDPAFGRDIILGARSMLAVQERVVDRMLDCWRRGKPSLLPERPVGQSG